MNKLRKESSFRGSTYENIIIIILIYIMRERER